MIKYMGFEKHGGKTAISLKWWHELNALMGRYDCWHRIRWESVTSFIFVCKGNICRSAYAHKFIADKITIGVSSAGLEATPDSIANAAAIACAARRGLDLTNHRAQNIRDTALDQGSLIIAFEPAHLKQLILIRPDAAICQLTLLGLYRSPVSPYIHDPYGLPGIYFDTCFEGIETGILKIVENFEGS